MHTVLECTNMSVLCYIRNSWQLLTYWFVLFGFLTTRCVAVWMTLNKHKHAKTKRFRDTLSEVQAVFFWHLVNKNNTTRSSNVFSKIQYLELTFAHSASCFGHMINACKWQIIDHVHVSFSKPIRWRHYILRVIYELFYAYTAWAVLVLTKQYFCS